MAQLAATRESGQGRLATLGWWALTLATLIVLDDLTFGPIFWLLARIAGQNAAVVAAFSIYVLAQIFLVQRGTSEHPGRLAGWVLQRLELERSNQN